MRLNRNSAIFIALLAVVIVVALIFLQDDGDNGSNQPDVEATVEIIRIFPDVSETNIVSVTITEIREVGDIRPTPIPGNPTLEPATPLPDGVEPETTTEIVALSKDAITSTWTVGEATTQTVTGAVNATLLESNLRNLVNVSSNRQFTPPNGDYEQYGLVEPRYDITFIEQPVAETGVVPAGEQAPLGEPVIYRLRIGNRTVGEGSYYAFLNDDTETIYVITSANLLQTSVLNLTSTVPVEPTLVPTPVPALNVFAPFANFVVTNAAGFTFSKTETSDEVIIVRNAENTAWLYTQNGTQLTIQQEFLQIILNSISTISGIDETTATDLAALGLDMPAYRFEARMVDGTTFVLQLGNQDPTGTIYYGLVNDFESVVLIDADSLALILPIFENPPVSEPEMTPEATAESTAEATEEAEMTPEATAEATADSD